MDKKRLKELRYNVIEYKNTRAFDICFEECDEIVDLIDAALAEPSDADVAEIIATGEYLYGLNDDNLADLVIQTNEVQNYIVESFTALRQYQKPTDEAVRDCSTCIGCDCEPPLGETVQDCKAYVKREPTDIADAIEAMKDNPLYNADIRKTILTALRQMRTEPCEICANFKRIECKADNLEFIAVRCPNCGRLVG